MSFEEYQEWNIIFSNERAFLEILYKDPVL